MRRVNNLKSVMRMLASSSAGFEHGSCVSLLC